MPVASDPRFAFAMLLALVDAVFSFPAARGIVTHTVPVAAIVQLAFTTLGSSQGQPDDIVPTLLGP